MRNTTKKTLAMILCLTMILTLLPAAAPTTLAAVPQWTAVGGPGFSAGLAFCTSMAIADDGTLYVAYKGNKAAVMKYTDAGWELVGSAGFSAGTTDYISLALAGGTPYVAYQDNANDDKATVMKYNGSVWEAVYTPGFSTGKANDVSLAIDSDGNPYVAYGDGSPGFKATVMKYSDVTGWAAVGSPRFSYGEAKRISMDIDSNGTPYVAYRDSDYSREATVMKYTDTGWVAVGSAGFSAGVAEYTSLAIDSSGTLYVAYKDQYYHDKATVMKYTDSGWEAVGSPGFSAGAATYTSLAIDSSGTLYVAYTDNYYDDKAMVMKYTDSGWEAVGSLGFSAGAATYTSLAIGSDGTLYVAYQDMVYSQKATVMRYIPDTIAPVLTAGGVSRSSDSAATVSFISDEEGQYYYEVVAEGAAAPAIDTSGAGTACGAGEQTIPLTSLSAEDRDIYIKVKDDSGNVSGALSMTIPALMAGIPNLTATAGSARVNLNWTPVAGSVSYSVYQSTTSGTYGSALDSVTSSVYSYDVTGLTNNTTYYFMVSALDSYGNTADSNEVSATPYRHSSSSGDDDGGSNPTVETSQATSVTETTATLQGKIESDGNADITEYGFMYGIDKSSLTNKEKVGTGNHRGIFTCGLSGLEAGTTYYYKAYARTDDAILYGGVLSFTTEKAVQPEPKPEPEPEEKQMFSDVPDTHWAYAPITQLCQKEAVSGYKDGSFRPDAPITRAEFITILVKALDLQAAATAQNFSDTADHWAQENITAAVSLSIADGYTDGSFKPDALITREQIAVMAVKAAGVTAGLGETAFADNDQISFWAKNNVLAAVDAGIMTGYPDNTFRPQGNATRAEAVCVILNLIK